MSKIKIEHAVKVPYVKLDKETGKPVEILEQDTDRDNWLSAEEAKEYGLIDMVIANRE